MFLVIQATYQVDKNDKKKPQSLKLQGFTIR